MGRGGGRTDAGELGRTLWPVLREVTGGRLDRIEWFRADWQRGGASTGYATWSDDDGSTVPVMVKVPVGPSEYRWTTVLGQPVDPVHSPTPRIFACGTMLGEYDLGWLVMERLVGHTLLSEKSKHSVLNLIDAAASAHHAARSAMPVTGEPPRFDWEDLIATGRMLLRNSPIPHSQRWNEALRRVQRALPMLISRWRDRPIDTWCHGDLHLGNAMRRATDEHHTGKKGDGHGACVLIDMAKVHPGAWVEDALYLERSCWGRPDLLCGVKPVSALAKARKKLGLPTEADDGHLVNTRRVLSAASVPALLVREGNARYSEAALEVIERLLPLVSG